LAEACVPSGQQRGYTALHLAVSRDVFTGLLLLLERIATLTAINYPVHPIHIAIAQSNNTALQLLLEHGGAKHDNGPQSAAPFQPCNNPRGAVVTVQRTIH
jgi:ankyrin repeat protein